MATTALRPEVQAAFRRKAREVHPDVGRGHRDIDLDVLAQARDTLLDAPPTGVVPSPQSAVPNVTRVPNRPAQSSGAFRGVWTLLRAVAGVAGVVVVGILVWAALASSDSADPGSVAVDDCLVVTGTDVTPAACDAADAQRVVAKLSGARSCERGQSALVLEATTWCLQAAEATDG